MKLINPHAASRIRSRYSSLDNDSASERRQKIIVLHDSKRNQKENSACSSENVTSRGLCHIKKIICSVLFICDIWSLQGFDFVYHFFYKGWANGLNADFFSFQNLYLATVKMWCDNYGFIAVILEMIYCLWFMALLHFTLWAVQMLIDVSVSSNFKQSHVQTSRSLKS